MKYKVIALFTDLEDNNYKYQVGDEYPRLGIQPSEKRIAELSGSLNKRKMPLIEKVETVKAEKKEEETVINKKAEAVEKTEEVEAVEENKEVKKKKKNESD